MFGRFIGRAWWSITLVLLGLAVWGSPPAVAAAGGTTPEWTWQVPPYSISPADALLVSGWPRDGCPGAPLLPYTATLISLPPDGTYSLTVRVLAWEHRQLAAPLADSPNPPAVLPYGDDCAPSSVVTLTPVGVMRGVRLARLTFTPFRYDAASRTVTVARAVRVSVRLAADGTSPPADGLTRGLQVLSRNALVGESPPLRARDTFTMSLLPVGWFTLTERGLYALPLSALTATGVLSSTCEPSLVHLIHGTQEISLRWQAEGRRFLFYAYPQGTRWSAEERYVVRYGEPSAARMTARSGDPAALPWGRLWAERVVERQRSYLSMYPSPCGGDHWYWQHLARPGASSWETTVTLPALAADTPATLTLWLQGDTAASAAPDHLVAVAWNHAPLGNVAWDGRTGITATLPVSAPLLAAGVNTLTLSLPGLSGVAVEGAWLDAFALRYAPSAWEESPLWGDASPAAYALASVPPTVTVYDIAQADAPRVVIGTILSGTTLLLGDAEGGARYFIAAQVRPVPPLRALPALTEPPGADYIAIAPARFAAALQPLLELRQAQGLRTFTVTPEAIYAAYGDGRMSPEAIRAFVAHAYATWSPRPAYLLLVGDGTWDPLHHLGNATPTFIPPYLVMADPVIGEVPADNRYVAVDGADVLPDLAVGRLPVNSAAELTAMVEKIVAYETHPQPGTWNLRHVLVADDSDAAGNFHAAADAVAAQAPLTATVVKLYCQDAPDDDPADPYCANVAELRPQLFEAWNRGALLFSWFGHSSFQQWEHGRLFHTDDLPLLHNDRRWPVMLSMTCYTGHFAHPDPLQTSLDEALARLPQAGAVASWGSSGEGYRQHQLPLAQAFYKVAFAPGLRLGDAMTVAKAALAGGAASYLIDTYHLFGDPAMRLHTVFVPWPEHVFCPLVANSGDAN